MLYWVYIIAQPILFQQYYYDDINFIEFEMWDSPKRHHMNDCFIQQLMIAFLFYEYHVYYKTGSFKYLGEFFLEESHHETCTKCNYIFCQAVSDTASSLAACQNGQAAWTVDKWYYFCNNIQSLYVAIKYDFTWTLVSWLWRLLICNYVIAHFRKCSGTGVLALCSQNMIVDQIPCKMTSSSLIVLMITYFRAWWMSNTSFDDNCWYSLIKATFISELPQYLDDSSYICWHWLAFRLFDSGDYFYQLPHHSFQSHSCPCNDVKFSKAN